MSPALLRDGISLCADDDDQFNSHSEEHQDLAPDTEIRSNASDIHSNMSSEDMKFQNLIEEVFKLLPADRFPRKTENVLGGNKSRSSIEMELIKAPGKSISLPQSKGPLSKTLDCIKQSMGSVEQKGGSYPMPSTIAQDWLPSKSDINKLVKLKYYQSHEELIPTATASTLDPDANRLDLSLSGSYPVKVSSLQSLEGQSRDMIRILSHAEIFSFAAFKSLQSENMDSKVLLEILKSMSMAVTDAMSLATAQTLGLQQMRREAAIESAPKGSLTTEAKRKLRLTPLTSKLLFGGQVSDIYKENVTENQAPGRDSFHSSLRRGVEHPEFVPSSQHAAVSEAHTGQVQHSSGPDVSNRQTDLHRVVPKSGNSKQDFPDHGLFINRPVCHTSEPQAATICVTRSGSEGAINRCHLYGLESHTRLCVSTVSSHSNCDKQNTDIPVQNSIGSSFMARQTMVSRAPMSVGVTTGISASNAKSACSAKRQNSASKPRSSTTSRLGIVKQSLRDKQFSSKVAEHVSKARRDSTIKVYDAKWQIFREWANERKIDPIQATPQIVADFLTFLFSVKKCQVSTIRGYRSTISNTLKF